MLPELEDSVSRLTGVGVKAAEKLERIGISRIEELLFHLPIRYQDKTRLTPIGALLPGQEALIEGAIERTWIQYGRRRSLSCVISDGSGAVTLKFFHFSGNQQKALRPGGRLRCYGQTRRQSASLEMPHPEYRHLTGNDMATEECLTPIYSLTEGLSQKKVHNLVTQALDIMSSASRATPELLPPEILTEFELPDLVSVVRFIHRPPPEVDLELLKAVQHPAQQRIAFEELLGRHLGLLRLRKKKRLLHAPVLTGDKQLYEHLLARFGFALTAAQNKALGEIERDLRKDAPMLRLLQGDVGSGKTVVAALAVARALGCGYQAALMAPTELLAEQHFQNFKKWLADSEGGEKKIEVLLFTSKASGEARRNKLDVLQKNTNVVAIGTHALFQKKISFARLGLVVIDEQHRFGVHQRLSLLNKGSQDNCLPHQLIMTATPIPRTLAMTIYADLDLSTIDASPPGRQTINTSIIENNCRDELIKRISVVCRSGRQVYWVCTMIEESEKLQCQTAVETFQRLSEALPGVKVGLIHGRMKSEEKERVMLAFKEREIQLLVATTVIEVGVDVPNASLIIIENAERLGLFQLHQLRGRVGRGGIKSDCVLMYQAPLSETAKARLETMRGTNDGFLIAAKDLQIRGAGDLIGTRQTGLVGMRVANLVRDVKLLKNVRRAAELLLSKYPEKVEALIKRWLEKEVDYGNV